MTAFTESLLPLDIDNLSTGGVQDEEPRILAAVLLIIGGLNWGLVALGEFDLVADVFGLDFGETNAATRIVYGLVGLAAVYAIGVLIASRADGRSRRRSHDLTRSDRPCYVAGDALAIAALVPPTAIASSAPSRQRSSTRRSRPASSRH